MLDFGKGSRAVGYPRGAESEIGASGVGEATERQRSEKRLVRPQGEQFGSLGTRGTDFSILFLGLELVWLTRGTRDG